jgi:leader peptidase (prepilin peptidase)/N-methyltransferase
MVLYVGKRLRGEKSSSADREMPLGPYLSMAAIALVLSWPWFWPNVARPYFEIVRVLFLYLTGQET